MTGTALTGIIMYPIRDQPQVNTFIVVFNNISGGGIEDVTYGLFMSAAARNCSITQNLFPRFPFKLSLSNFTHLI